MGDRTRGLGGEVLFGFKVYVNKSWVRPMETNEGHGHRITLPLTQDEPLP